MPDAEERRSLDHLVDRLQHRFPTIPQQRIRETVADAHSQFDEARIRSFIPVLVEHDVTMTLKGPTV
jgi:hypothetical protein